MSTRTWTIRAAGRADLPALLSCLRTAFGPYESSYTPGAYADTVLTGATARRRLVEMHVLVAEDGTGALVGTIAWGAESSTTGHLRGMAVLPDAMGRGVAQALLDRALKELADAGYRRVTLDTTEPLLRAITFYERNGFRPTGRTSDFFGMVLTERARPLGTARSRRDPKR
jgi:GNAT superfamily N-acetyltransferase